MARGLAFTGALKIANEMFGPHAVELITRDAPAVRAITGSRISGLRWYPYTAFAELLALFRNELGGRDSGFCSKIGLAAGKRDLATIFTAYTVKPSPERLIRACTGVWASYYKNAGRMKAVSCTPDRTVVRIFGFSSMSQDHCRLMEGWMVSAMDVIGADVLPGAGETTCASQGGAFHEFRCQWTPATSSASGVVTSSDADQEHQSA